MPWGWSKPAICSCTEIVLGFIAHTTPLTWYTTLPLMQSAYLPILQRNHFLLSEAFDNPHRSSLLLTSPLGRCCWRCASPHQPLTAAVLIYHPHIPFFTSYHLVLPGTSPTLQANHMGILLLLISQATQADPKRLISITFLIENSYSWLFSGLE